MNKLKKIGLSALAGSLAAVSANAGDFSISGGAELSWTTSEDAQRNDNPIGMKKGLGFSYSGELDNGWTWSGVTTYADGAEAFASITSAGITFTMGDMGTLAVGNTTEAIGDIDDKLPTAYEEAWNGVDSGPSQVGMGSGHMITYVTPEMAAGTTLTFTLDPGKGGTMPGSGAESATGGDAVYEVAFKSSPIDGLTLYGGVAEEQCDNVTNTIGGSEECHWEAIWTAVYALGPLSIGYLQSGEDPGTTKTNGTKYLENEGYSASFQVNDDLTISFANYTSESRLNNATTSVEMDIDGINISYSMGAASLRLTDSQSKNANYSTTTVDQEHTELNLSLSF
jgi:outer membrane protein OmpU